MTTHEDDVKEFSKFKQWDAGEVTPKLIFGLLAWAGLWLVFDWAVIEWAKYMWGDYRRKP